MSRQPRDHSSSTEYVEPKIQPPAADSVAEISCSISPDEIPWVTMQMAPQVRDQLIAAALAVRQHAHAPYSRFHVGAAVLTPSGERFAGCNVENASYGLTICAERAAVCAAVAAGHKEVVAVAVVTAGGHSPCGACRQVLSEFGPAMEVLLVDADAPEKVRNTTLAKLLPDQFTL